MRYVVPAVGDSVLTPSQRETSRPPTPKMVTDPEGPNSPSTEPADPPPLDHVSAALPKLAVRIISTDVTKHLDGIHRQKGGIGRQGYDSTQKDLRKFFSGGG